MKTVTIDLDDLEHLLRLATHCATQATAAYAWARQPWAHAEMPAPIRDGGEAASQYRQALTGFLATHPEVKP